MTIGIGFENLFKSLQLLNCLAGIGVKHFILSPGSRSAPLAIAACELYKRGKINLINSLDERSAGFHGLGISAASGDMTAVITTSGTAVANLLPSAVEADKSNNPILFLTADRPLRLKNCGANQTVNQEEFLESVCRKCIATNKKGLHHINDYEIQVLINSIKDNNDSCPGPIHLNISFEKPLILSKDERRKTFDIFWKKNLENQFIEIKNNTKRKITGVKLNKSYIVNVNQPGIIIVGPYQGSIKDLKDFNHSLQKMQDLSGWPIFADPCSGVNINTRGIIDNWELIISNKNKIFKCNQLIRLGPMSSSIYLEDFLNKFNGRQILIKEKDLRNLDPLKKTIEYDFGLKQYMNQILVENEFNLLENVPLITLAKELIHEGDKIKNILKKEFLKSNKITESLIANRVPRLWPEHYPIMLSASSPIRDWLTFSENKTLSRRCFSFRGASGIDGTLSLALGISRIDNPLLLVTGDLSFLHDTNGLLIENCLEARLTILLLDNKGGNIFNRLYKNDFELDEINKLFVMPKETKWKSIAETYQIPYKTASGLDKLKECFKWSLSLDKTSIIKVNIDTVYENYQRRNIFNSIYENTT